MATKQGGMGFRSPALEEKQRRLAAAKKKKNPVKKMNALDRAKNDYNMLKRGLGGGR